MRFSRLVGLGREPAGWYTVWVKWSPEALGEVLSRRCGGSVVRAGTAQIAKAFIDSRNPVQGALFVPIVARRDGHDFIPHAIEGGAAAVLIRKDKTPPEGDLTVIQVPDTLAALTELAREAREVISGPVVAITGSNGKTTTRALVEAVLRSAHGEVLCTHGNLNNHLGVPLTLLDEPHAPDAAVIELGMSAPGENDHLAGIVRPTVGIITSIAIEHLEFLGTLQAIAAAEAEVMAHVAEGGALVVPVDEPLIENQIPEGYRPRVLRVGPEHGADVQVVSVEVAERTRVKLLVGGEPVDVALQLFGAHNARNAASALAVAMHLGLPLAPAVEAIEAVEPVGDRGRVLPFGAHLLVADCYNANPGSMEAALHSLQLLSEHRDGPLVAVLGDMLELGPSENELHAEVGTLAADLRIDAVVGFGPRSAHLVEAAKKGGVGATLHVEDDVAAAAAFVRTALGDAEPGAALFKGSRGMRLERVIEALTD